MSNETKTNVVLGVSAVALVATASSFIYTNKQVEPIVERLDSVEEDLTNIAISLDELRSVYSMEMSRTKQSLKSVGKKIDRLEKKYKKIDGLREELSMIKSEILDSLSSSTLTSDAPVIPKKENKKEKRKKKEESIRREERVKEESSSSEDDSDEDLQKYISTLK